MRVLKFIVDDQIIRLDPTCNIEGLVPGTENYIQAEFNFSADWSGYRKVAAFWSPMGKEYPPQILTDGKTCNIPAEALKRRVFKVQVLGKKDDVTIKTNKVAVSQNGGKA